MRRLLLVGLLLALIATGCRGGAPSPTPPASPTPQPTLPTAPDFQVATVEGSSFTLAQHRGKVVVLMATASWCTSCIPEVRTLARIHREYQQKGVEVLILSVWPRETEQDWLRFRERVGGGDHLWAIDRDGLWARAYQIRALGTTIIVDRRGGIAYRDESATSYQTYRAQIEKLL